MTNPTVTDSALHEERRHVVIYGYEKRDLMKVMRHFEQQLPDYIKLTMQYSNLVSKLTLTGHHSGVELLRFMINKYHRNLIDLFPEEVIATANVTVAQMLGQLLHERELTVATAESCTGGSVAQSIVKVPGSSSYFLGSVVSYSNDVKADVLGVARRSLETHGAVSRQVVEQMAKGVAKLMRTDCAIATSGIAGPDGGTRFKPVGTVWIAVKCLETVVSECVHFNGDRIEVMESATNHAIVMLINVLRNSYIMQEDFNDE